MRQGACGVKVIERPGEEPTCEHGRALDVHCCGCHSGFLFDSQHCTCLNPDHAGISSLQAETEKS